MYNLPDEWSRNTVKKQPHTESARAFNALRQQVIALSSVAGAAIARAEAAEAKLAAILKMLRDEPQPNDAVMAFLCGGTIEGVRLTRSHLLARAVSIAEGWGR